MSVCVCFVWCFARQRDELWVSDFGLGSAWVSGLWWVCVCLLGVLFAGVMGLPLYLSSFFSLIWVL